jgi:hypothetical protein
MTTANKDRSIVKKYPKILLTDLEIIFYLFHLFRHENEHDYI